MTTKIIRLIFFGFINAAIFFSLINGQRQIPSQFNNQFFPTLQRPNLQLIQLHAAQQQQRSFPPLDQRRLFRTQQQQQQQQRRLIPRISLRRRSSSSERNLRAGISRNKPARIILDPNLSNEKITSENRFPPQLRTQGNAATTAAPQRFAPPRQQRPPPPIEVTPSRIPVRPSILRRPSPLLRSTQTQPLQQRSPQPQQQQRQQRPPLAVPQQQQPPPRPPPQQSRAPPQQQQLRAPLQQQQQQPPPPQRASTQQQQQSFLRAPVSPASMTPRMSQQQPQQNFQNRAPASMPRPPMPRPQTRSQSAPSAPQQQQQTLNQPRHQPPMQQVRPPPPAMPSPPAPPPPQQQQQMRPRITPEQRFTRPEQARVLPPPPPPPSAPIGPPRPSPSITTNNIDEAVSPQQQSRVRPSLSPSSAHMPGFLPPSNSVVDELNHSQNFLEVARRLHLRRVIRGSAH